MACRRADEVRRFADHAALARLVFAQHLAHHDRPGSDAHAGRQRSGLELQSRDRRHGREAGAHRALGVVLLRPRPAEVGEDAVAKQLGDVAALAPDRPRDGAMVSRHHLAQVLGVKARRQRGRARQVAEQHRELPPLRAVVVGAAMA